MNTIKVAVADDDEQMRAALSDVLGADQRFALVGAVGSGSELLDLVAATEVDLVLLDVRMPGGGLAALGALGDLRAQVPPRSPAVVIVSAQTSPRQIVNSLRAGAAAYLAKGRLGSSLPDLLVRVTQGETVLVVPDAASIRRQLVASA